MGIARLRSGASRLVEDRVMTIFSKWVERVEARPGEPVDVYLGGDCVATAFYEGVGAVGLRVLGWECGLDVEETLRSRIREAYAARRALPIGGDAYRLVNAEGDGLPGLIIDVYRDIAVVQSSSVGVDRYMDVVVSALRETLDPRLVYARHDQRSRREAGLPLYRGALAGEGPPRTVVSEGRARLRVDVERGQKTGLFLDQRDNRLFLESLVGEGASVLDLYSYTGGFALHALLGGAGRAVLVEESPWAASEARRNLELNGVAGGAEIVVGRVEEFLARNREEFDVVVADPPALIQSAASKERGVRAYKALYGALGRVVSRGGLLVASSCSYFLDAEEFLDLLGSVLAEEGREARILRVAGASIDHVSRPVDRHLRYLKTVFMRLD